MKKGGATHGQGVLEKEEPKSSALPPMVGLHADEAKQAALEIYPNIDVEIMDRNSRIIENFCSHRLRIFVDDQQKVIKQPIFE